MENMERVFLDPAMFLMRFNPQLPLQALERADFVGLQQDELRRLPFLDERLPYDNNDFSASITDLAASKFFQQQSVNAPAYIFHTAFCCSTLLANLLDHKGYCLSLREPLSLTQLADWRRGMVTRNPGIEKKNYLLALEIAIASMAVGYVENERIVIKLHNRCTNIAVDLLDMHETARAIFIYSDLRGFLVSVLKSEERRRWVHNQLTSVQFDAGSNTLVRQVDLSSLKDVEAASYLWLLNVSSYVAASESNCSSIHALNCEVLLKSPVEMVSKVASHLHLDIGRQQIEGTVLAGALNFHAKSKHAYNARFRAKEMRMLSKQFSKEISHGLWWAGNNADRSLTGKLPEPL